MLLETEIGSGLRDLGTPFVGEFAQAEDVIATLLRDVWKSKALEVRAYRSGDYYRSIVRDANAIHSGDTRIRDVLSEVGYADIIERGRRDTPNYPGRFPAEQAVDAADYDITKILSDAAGRVIDRIENG